MYNVYLPPRVHTISREGECLTAYACFKHTVSSTKSTPPGVNYISAPIRKVLLDFIKQNVQVIAIVLLILSTSTFWLIV